DLVFSVIPDDYGQFIARGSIPLHGSGKVKTGNRVNIRLSNYPYQEFGVLQGEIIHVAAIPSGEHFPVQIRLYNQLQTSYYTDLGHHVMLEGIAQIITEDISLFNRMINPLRSLRRNR
ncbi:MAG: HlyD family secretion protein, partial [Bacteroidetes bacterium]